MDVAGVFVRRNRCFHEILEFGNQALAALGAGRRDDVGGDLLPAFGAGRADHRTFGHRGVGEEGILDLGRGDVVARADDYVVGARAVPIIAVGIAGIGVAGDVPAVLDVIGLA